MALGRLSLAPRAAARLRDSGERVVVTGASGWMGRATLEMLEGALGGDFDAQVHAFASRPRQLTMRSGREIALRAIGALRELRPAPTMLLHYAFLTKDRLGDTSTAAYYEAAEALSAQVLHALEHLDVRRMLFPSSGAVYGLPMRPDRSLVEEPERNPYGTQKLREERRFAQACATRRVRLAVPRVFSVSGPFINKHEAYALASVILAVLAGHTVELRAKRRVLRSYVPIEELLNVCLGWLLADDAAEHVVFDSGGVVVEIEDLARTALRALRREDLTVVRPAPDGSPDDHYYGNSFNYDTLAAQLGVPAAPLERQIADTAAYLVEAQ